MWQQDFKSLDAEVRHAYAFDFAFHPGRPIVNITESEEGTLKIRTGG
jgi:hypothetical protein